MEQYEKYIFDHLSKFVGGKIVAVGSAPDEGGSYHRWPILEVAMPSGKLLQVQASQDPEGNGPGWLFIEEAPTKRELTTKGLACDWGNCGRPATMERISFEHGWLPVCEKHEYGQI